MFTSKKLLRSKTMKLGESQMDDSELINSFQRTYLFRSLSVLMLGVKIIGSMNTFLKADWKMIWNI